MDYNPYREKLEKKRAQLARLERQQTAHNAGCIPGTLVTGGSGVPASRCRRLDRQLDRTINLAVRKRALTREVKYLELKSALYDEGKINAAGRRITPKVEPKYRWSAGAKERARIMRAAMLDLSIYGRHTLPTGHAVEVLVGGWDEDNLIGLIRVTSPEGEVTECQAKSVQGVDLMAIQERVILAILKGEMLGLLL